MNDESIRTSEIAGQIWLELLQSPESERERLLAFLERMLGPEHRAQIEVALEEMRHNPS